jgi:hypothetical protein
MSEKGKRIFGELIRRYEADGLSRHEALKRAKADLEELSRTGKLPKILGGS